MIFQKHDWFTLIFYIFLLIQTDFENTYAYCILFCQRKKNYHVYSLTRILSDLDAGYDDGETGTGSAGAVARGFFMHLVMGLVK